MPQTQTQKQVQRHTHTDIETSRKLICYSVESNKNSFQIEGNTYSVREKNLLPPVAWMLASCSCKVWQQVSNSFKIFTPIGADNLNEHEDMEREKERIKKLIIIKQVKDNVA